MNQGVHDFRPGVSNRLKLSAKLPTEISMKFRWIGRWHLFDQAS